MKDIGVEGGGAAPAPGYAMSVEQFNRWMTRCAAGKWGWIHEHKRIGTYLIARARERIKRRAGPDGRPWKPLHHAPRPRVGQRAGVILARAGEQPRSAGSLPARVPSVRSGGSPFAMTKDLRTRGDVRAAVLFRQRYGPPFRPVPALVRTGKAPGARKTTFIRDFLRTRGRALRVTTTTLTYGFTPGTRWMEDLQFGGRSKRFKGAAIPPRPVVGMNGADIDAVEKVYADGYLKRVMKAG